MLIIFTYFKDKYTLEQIKNAPKIHGMLTKLQVLQFLNIIYMQTGTRERLSGQQF